MYTENSMGRWEEKVRDKQRRRLSNEESRRRGRSRERRRQRPREEWKERNGARARNSYKRRKGRERVSDKATSGFSGGGDREERISTAIPVTSGRRNARNSVQSSLFKRAARCSLRYSRAPELLLEEGNVLN